MKQVIYIDVLIYINLIINYFLLFATSKFLFLKLTPLRLFFAEFLSAFYSLYILLPDSSILISLIVRIFMALSIVGVAFGIKNVKVFFKSIIYFFAVSFSFSGIMFGLWYLIKPNGMAINNGVVYFNISPLTLISSTLVAYTFIEITNRILGKKENKNLICKVTFKIGEKTINFTAKIDTCNSLREPFSNLPVIVVSNEVLKSTIPEFMNFEKIINKNFEKLDLKLRFIPFQTVSGDGLLPAFKPKYVKIGNSEKEAYIAVCKNEALPLHIKALVNPLLID